MRFGTRELCLAVLGPGQGAELTPCFLLGKKLGYTFNHGNLHNVSLGQGQEVVAEQALDLAAKEGHWVILQVRGRWPVLPSSQLVPWA